MRITALAAHNADGRLPRWLSVRHSLRTEAVAVLALYGLYELTRGLVLGDADVASAHANRLVAVKRSLHLLSKQTCSALCTLSRVSPVARSLARASSRLLGIVSNAGTSPNAREAS